MGRSRRKYKQSRTKVRVGLPKKNPRLFKPSFSVPPKLLQSLDQEPQWDAQGTVNTNYSSFDVLSDPNSLTELSSDPQTIDSGSDVEEDDLKSALGKKRRDGRSAPPQPLTGMQRIHISRLVAKYGDDYQYVGGYKAESNAAFNWNSAEAVHEDTVFDPVSLICGHIFCYTCACSAASVTIVNGLKAANPKEKCPLCREGSVYEDAVHLEELNTLLGRSCRGYWEQRLQMERVERVKQVKEHWETQFRAFMGI